MTFFFFPPLFLNICPKCPLLFFFFLSRLYYCSVMHFALQERVRQSIICTLGITLVQSLPHDSLQLQLMAWLISSYPLPWSLQMFAQLHLSLQATLHSYTQFHSTWIYSALCSCHISCLLNAFTLLNIYLELKDIITQHLLQQVTGDDSFRISITAFWIILPSSIEQFRVQGCSETEQ